MNKGYLYAILSAIVFSTQGIFLKLGADSIPPMTMSFYRFSIAFLFFILTVPFIDKTTFRITKKEGKEYAIIGLILSFSGILYTLGFYYAPVQNVVLINYLYPFFSLLLGAWVLKERITKTKIITLLIAMSGMVIINPFQLGPYALGNILSLFNALMYGMLIVGLRKEDQNHGIGDIMWFFLFATLFQLPMPFIFGWGNISAVWPFVLLVGIFSTGIAHLLLNLSLQKIEASQTSVIDLILSPLLAILLAMAVLGEPVSLQVLLGGSLLVMAGIYLEMHNLHLEKHHFSLWLKHVYQRLIFWKK